MCVRCFVCVCVCVCLRVSVRCVCLCVCVVEIVRVAERQRTPPTYGERGRGQRSAVQGTGAGYLVWLGCRGPEPERAADWLNGPVAVRPKALMSPD